MAGRTITASTDNGDVTSRILVNRPRFSDVWNSFPKGMSAGEVYELVGGKVYELYLEDKDAYANACALRMSEALNQGGYVIKSGADGFNGYRAKGKILDYSTLPDVKRNYFAYYLRVSDMIKFLNKNFGEADEVFTDGGDAKKKLSGKKGIVVFTISGWADATGHVAVWNGSDFADGSNDNYFDLDIDPYANRGGKVKLTKVEYWELR